MQAFQEMPHLRGSVLIVDDDQRVGTALRRLLNAYDVVVAESGRRALELCSRRDFDVIFCDLMMPEVTGAEFYHHLKQRQPGREEKVVFITGGAITVDARLFTETVPNLVLYKPVDPRKLLNLTEQRVGARAD